ncbi:TetR family transcriptional regulator [Saccharopolyspora sp. HNM0983]|uniref:TetR family transcriptional regulator n=1 Tax=Saccharopolyspora montiporae TaxID=2781240 RepID=A0A929B6N6_9PSEU|nr:TetR family transcriptional regulator [Saccharopolyspora sp. HNM0983]
MSSSDERSGPGKQRSGNDAGQRLLAAARATFAELGYESATVRTIAARAGVDPAMVNHRFGGKEHLFTAAMAIPVDPAEVLPGLLGGDPQQLAERLLRLFLEVWDGAGGGRFAALVRSASSNESAARMLREFVQDVVFRRVTEHLGVDHPELRTALCATQVVGLGMARYIVRLEPLASADHDTVVRTVAPNLQHYLTGDLG